MLLWTATIGLCLSAAAAPAAEKPNIVLVITDDQGYGDLSGHGNPILKTPHMDALRDRTSDAFGVSPPFGCRSESRPAGAASADIDRAQQWCVICCLQPGRLDVGLRGR